MPRLFTALEIPPDIARSLTMLRGGLPGAHWIEPENYHITLRFIGDIDDVMADDVASILDGVRRESFDVQIEGLTSFGGRKPRAVVAAVAASKPLMELQAEQERLMQRVGLVSEGRKYTPHVTLARLRNTTNRQTADYLSLRGGYRAASFRVTRVVLFSARESTGGGPYMVEADYPLTATA